MRWVKRVTSVLRTKWRGGSLGWYGIVNLTRHRYGVWTGLGYTTSYYPAFVFSFVSIFFSFEFAEFNLFELI
jgi:hypothetical protein